jgi:Outer membrane protein beta-barrel domain
MLNLSDKDLDRLSREAASEHDPGDIVGPRSWDKLEVRLDRHLGHVTSHVARGFYRLPFYYAPVVLLILGATYYFIRNHRAQKEASSGSPPLTLVNPTGNHKPSASSQNPIQTDKSTSTLVLPPATAEQPTAPAAGAGPRHDLTAAGSATSAAPAGTVPGSPSVPATGNSAAPRTHFTRRHPANGHDRSITPSFGSSNPTTGLSDLSTDRPDNASADGTLKRSGATGATPSSGTAPLSGARQLSLATVRGPVPTKRPGSVSDSALRAFTVKAIPTPIQRKGGLYINRSLQIGVLVAPDFSSVNSMSGDKPGSTIGLTADYQFAHHWHVGSGLLLSRKNYAAAPQDFHPPKDFYSTNHMSNIDFIKGSFSMLEIPLNLRYDFSVTGNTLFFATAGLSSYLMTSENCNYYYQWFNQPSTKRMHYGNQPDYLFSALDLSVGVEMGVSNTLSVLVAPYVKVPVRNIGFGQVELSSVGINFILEFAPVLSRRR